MSSVLWLRRDLRRRDLPALGAAADATADDVHVLFVIDPILWEGAGPVRRGWLAASIRAAAESYDGRLTVRVGDPTTTVAAFANEVGAESVHVSAETTPYGARRDDRVRKSLAERGIEWVPTGSPYAVGPGRVRNQDGGPYRVFTPFARAWREHGWSDPAPAPRGISLGDDRSDAAASKRLERALVDCPVDLPTAGEDAALRRWRSFRDEHLSEYADDRDRPDRPGHEPALAVPQGRRDPPPHDARGPLRRAIPGRTDLRRRAGLARVLRRRAPQRAAVGVA